jgi:hypothetical protein
MIRNVSMVATLVAVLGVPLAASAGFMDDLPDACQAALLVRRIALLRCKVDCSRLPDHQAQAQCEGTCLARNAYRSVFVFSRPVCSTPQEPNGTPQGPNGKYDCSSTSGMCTCEGASLTEAAGNCVKLLFDGKCASPLSCMGSECVCIK